MPFTYKNILQRFSRLVDMPVETDCWIWTGTRGSWGYGHIKSEGRLIGAHRLSYEMFKGPIPDGMSVLHTCDIPACVNPKHLDVGTQSDNLKDAYRKGRKEKSRVRLFEHNGKLLNIAEISRLERVSKQSLRYQLVIKERSVVDAIRVLKER